MLAFSYGTEFDPIIAASISAKLTRTTPHTHVSPPPSSYKATLFVPIPIKAVTDVFTGMPKKSARHRDVWAWELFRDMAKRPKTADLFRSFIEFFFHGKLPKPMWEFLSTASMIPFHKLAQIERDLLN